MKELKFHTGGRQDHLAELKAELRQKVRKINDSSATPNERAAQIEAARQDFERKKQDLPGNLY